MANTTVRLPRCPGTAAIVPAAVLMALALAPPQAGAQQGIVQAGYGAQDAGARLGDAADGPANRVQFALGSLDEERRGGGLTFDAAINTGEDDRTRLERMVTLGLRLTPVPESVDNDAPVAFDLAGELGFTKRVGRSTTGEGGDFRARDSWFYSLGGELRTDIPVVNLGGGVIWTSFFDPDLSRDFFSPYALVSARYSIARLNLYVGENIAPLSDRPGGLAGGAYAPFVYGEDGPSWRAAKLVGEVSLSDAVSLRPIVGTMLNEDSYGGLLSVVFYDGGAVAQNNPYTTAARP